MRRSYHFVIDALGPFTDKAYSSSGSSLEVAKVSNHLQTDNRSKIENRLQTPRMVAAAADLTHSILNTEPDRLAHSQGSLAGPIF